MPCAHVAKNVGLTWSTAGRLPGSGHGSGQARLKLKPGEELRHMPNLLTSHFESGMPVLLDARRALRAREAPISRTTGTHVHRAPEGATSQAAI